METPSESSSELKRDNPHPRYPEEIPDHALRSELESLRLSYHSLQSKFKATEETLALLQQRMNESANHNARLREEIAQINGERDSLLDKVCDFETILKEKEEEFSNKLDKELVEKEGLKKEVEDFKVRVQELESESEDRKRLMLKSLDIFNSVKDCLSRVMKGLQEEKDEILVRENEDVCEASETGEEYRLFLEDVKLASKLAMELESMVEKYKEVRKKEKKELENSLTSLTEENRDVNKLLRIALLEKEAVEKRLKGSDYKRVPLLQFAERIVGLGFMMGGGTNEQPTDSSGAKSDGSDNEEEVVTLVSSYYL